MSSCSSPSRSQALASVQVQDGFSGVEALCQTLALASHGVEGETSLATGDSALGHFARAGIVVPGHVRGKAHASHGAFAFAAVFVLDVWGVASVVADLLLDVTDASARVSIEIVTVVAHRHANLVTNTVILVQDVTGVALEATSVEGPFALAS